MKRETTKLQNCDSSSPQNQGVLLETRESATALASAATSAAFLRETLRLKTTGGVSTEP
jgi:hypothetical protein